MLRTLKTAGKIWVSSLRFAFHSPKLLLFGYALCVLIDYVAEIGIALSEPEFAWFRSSLAFYPAVVLAAVVFAAALALFHLYGMRSAMRFATGRLDAWTTATWLRRGLDYIAGYAAYMGLIFLLVPVFAAVLKGMESSTVPRTVNDVLNSVEIGYVEPASRMTIDSVARVFAYGLLGCTLLFLIVRISLWMPMAAFRRDEQWSPVVAWQKSQGKVALISCTLLLLEIASFGLLAAFESSDGIRQALLDEIMLTNVNLGANAIYTEAKFLFDVAERLIFPVLFCVVIAIRTSLAANMLGIGAKGQKEEYFNYMIRSEPT